MGYPFLPSEWQLYIPTHPHTHPHAKFKWKEDPSFETKCADLWKKERKTNKNTTQKEKEKKNKIKMEKKKRKKEKKRI